MKSVCVFCGSSPGHSVEYHEAAKKLGDAIVKNGLRLVYGGAKVGLMSILADTVCAHGGEVTGIMPRALVEMEVAHQGLTELIIVESMHQRKQRMEELSDGFIAMPGGFGTLDEIFEMITWAQLKFHQKPCAFFNVKGYWDQLDRFMHHMADEGFIAPPYLDMILSDDHPEALLEKMRHFKPLEIDKARFALGRTRNRK